MPVTRDTWFSNVGKEADGNNGGAPKLKLKSHQEMSLIDIDTAPLKGRAVQKNEIAMRRLRLTVNSADHRGSISMAGHRSSNHQEVQA